MRIDVPYEIGQRVVMIGEVDIDARVSAVAVYATGVSVLCKWWDGRTLKSEWLDAELVAPRE